MGVKWTCALFCLLGIAFIQIEAASTFRHASVLDRSKRDVSHLSSHSSSGPGGSSISSSSSSSSSSGGSGTSFSSSGPGPSIGSRAGVPAAENQPFYSGAQPPYAGAAQNFGPTGYVGQSWSGPPQNQAFGQNFNNVPNVGSYPYYPDQNAAFQAYAFNFQNFLQQSIRNLQAQQELFNSQFLGQNQPSLSQNNRLDNGSPFNQYPNNFGVGNRGQFGNDFPTNPNYNQNQQFPNSVGGGFSNSFGQPQSAFASSAIGPQGGFIKGEISPASPGITSRFSETVPAPNGQSYGSFASSSSSSRIGPDGKTTGHKSATSGTIENGKVTAVRTTQDR